MRCACSSLALGPRAALARPIPTTYSNGEFCSSPCPRGDRSARAAADYLRVMTLSTESAWGSCTSALAGSDYLRGQSRRWALLTSDTAWFVPRSYLNVTREQRAQQILARAPQERGGLRCVLPYSDASGRWTVSALERCKGSHSDREGVACVIARVTWRRGPGLSPSPSTLSSMLGLRAHVPARH